MSPKGRFGRGPVYAWFGLCGLRLKKGQRMINYTTLKTGVVAFLMPLLLSGCLDAHDREKFSIEREKLALERERFEFEKSKKPEKYFILNTNNTNFILNKETGEIFKFYSTDTGKGMDFGYQPLAYHYGPDKDGNDITISSPDDLMEELRIRALMKQNKSATN